MTLDVLGQLVREIHAEQRAQGEQRRETVLLLQAVAQRLERVDQSILELRDDLELVIRAARPA